MHDWSDIIMMYKIFVDGQEGTTGLKIFERLEKRDDVRVLYIDPAKRKDISERGKLINEADIVFLCLPDDAAKESVALVENDKTRIIDASTAHRTNDDWVYGLPELGNNQRSAIENSKRVCVPGCFATGFILLLHPLIKEGIVLKDYPATCHAVSGYSGGGKKLINQYEDVGSRSSDLDSPRFYSLALKHKHTPEMQKFSGLDSSPIFTPIVADFYEGMTVAVPLYSRLLTKKQSAKEIRNFLESYYNNQNFIKVLPFDSEKYLDNGYLGATACNGTNNAQIFVFGNEENILLTARFDNLGKGASGAAIQNMNIMLGLDERKGLI